MGRKITATVRVLQVQIIDIVRGGMDGDPLPLTEPATGDAATGADPEEDLSGPAGDALVHRVIAGEMGDRLAELMRQARRAQERWQREEAPDEGLRERKRRLTRQLISDAATAMFATRGFDNVTVAEVAHTVGVSEKTVYNYFPTKESLVLDLTDETIERVATALRDRGPGESLTAVVVGALKEDMASFARAPDELLEFLPAFAALIEGTPALRAAWLEVHDRLATVAREELAALADVDPQAPEAMIAGRGLAGLAEVAFESQRRHAERGLRGAALLHAVGADLDRAGRLLETGLWSFQLLARGASAKQQARQAAKAAEEARAQVVKALRQAHSAWHQLRSAGSNR
jgi:AcrR family transcriptional regulator